MKLARYRRVSSKKQVRKGESLQGQVLKTDVWAKHNDHVIIKDYVDEGVSGWKGTRRAYDQLLEDITDPESEIEGVIVYSISRISRNLLILLTAVQLFEEHNISFFSATENLPQDRSSNRLMIAITGAVSQNQSDVNAVYVKDRLNETAEQGFFTGGRVPFGYTTIEVRDNSKKKKRKKLNVFEEEATVVSKIFNLCVYGTSGKGLGLKAIATHLNQAGLTHRGNRWTITSLGRLLHDTTYIGKRIYGKNRKSNSSADQPIISKNPSIISNSLFDKAAKELDKRKPSNIECKGERSNSLLTGILKCPYCNSNMIINTGKSGRYKYYKCSNKIKTDISSCPQKPIPMALVEDKIIEVLLNEIVTKSYLSAICDHVKAVLKNKSKGDTKIKLSKESQLSETKQQLKRLFLMLSTEEIAADDDLDELLSDLKSKRKTLELELKQITQRAHLPIWKFGDAKIQLFVKAVKNVLFSEDRTLTKSFLRATIDRIDASSTKIEVIGSNMGMINAISKTKMGTSFEVPTSVSIWR